MGEKLGGSRSLLRRIAGWFCGDEASVGPLLALMIVPIVGAMAIGGETSSWYLYNRAQQNAADSAVLAAALKKNTSEGGTVAISYGYTNGSNNTTVDSTTTTCPTGAISGSTCYQVTVTKKYPIYLSRIVGFNGDTTVGTNRATTIRARAIAGLTTGTNNFCLIGLNSITLNGGPGTNLTGCQLLSGGNMACNGASSDNGVSDGYAVGTNKNSNCGTNAVSGYTGFSGDTMASTVANNLASACTSYTTVTTLSSVSSGVNCFNANGGTISLTAPITINNANTVIVIKNGGLNINNFKLSTTGTGSVTIVWTGATGANSVLQSSGGTLDIAAPSDGAWKGMALIEDPALTGQQINVSGAGKVDSRDLDFSGGANTITLDLTGLIYAPNATVNVSGAIDHASNGLRCIGIVANTIVASGTNDIFANPTSQCRQAGLTLPTVPKVSLLA